MPDNVTDALEIIKAIGLPAAQHNERTALCLLALAGLTPTSRWNQARDPLMGITPIMEWIGRNYNKSYAPNTRETIRKHSLQIFVDAGLALPNPDQPERPVNSPRWVYQLSPEALGLLRTYGTKDWDLQLAKHLGSHQSLVEKYANQRELLRVPLRMKKGDSLALSPGAHSELIKAIVEEFGSRFIPEGHLVYVGDTGEKWAIYDRDLLESLGVEIPEHGIMPDVVIYCPKRNWLVLAEAVVSSGAVDGKRHQALKKLFEQSKAGLIFVTAFPNQKIMRQYICDIAWETEVWRADAASHLIHFNGERFLGPYG
jgi:hypothetical protein